MMKMEHKQDGFYMDFPEYDSIAALLRDTCSRYDTSVAFTYYDEGNTEQNITYGQFWQEIERTARVILDRFSGSSRIGVVCRNSYACIVIFYAVLTAGKTAVMTEPDISAQALEELMGRMDTDCVLVPQEWRGETALQTVSYEEILNAAAAGDTELPTIQADTTAFILFTSGTTGKRHGVMLSHRNMAEAIRGGTIYRLYDKQPSLLLVLPLYHMYGLVVLLCHLAIGSRFCINHSLKQLKKDLRRYQPQIMECVPLMLEYLYKKINQGIDHAGKRQQFELMRRISGSLDKCHIHIARRVFASVLEPLGGNLEFIICGGAFLDKELIDFFHTIGIEVYEGYGLTETATFVTVNTDRYHRYGSVGIATPYNDVKIVDDEIWIRGSNIMQGYYGEEALTASVFEGEWFKTGDIGYVDEDGYLYLTGRKKNLLILSNGQNISPEQIENELQKSELIEEVVVSEKKGRIHAEIYTPLLADESEEELGGRIQDVIDAYNRSCARVRHVTTFSLRSEPFDKTVTMKIKRG